MRRNMKEAERHYGKSSQRATLTRPLFALLFCSFFAAVTGRARAQITLPAPGIINTLAGNGTAGWDGDGQLSTNTSVELNNPLGLAVDAAGNIFIADSSNSRIRKIAASTGDISTVAGSGT